MIKYHQQVFSDEIYAERYGLAGFDDLGYSNNTACHVSMLDSFEDILGAVENSGQWVSYF